MASCRWILRWSCLKRASSYRDSATRSWNKRNGVWRSYSRTVQVSRAPFRSNPKMSTELTAFFDRVRPAIDATLSELLPPENASPQRLHEAMRYSTLEGGKRIRPCLCVAAFAAYKDDWRRILPVAAAVEMIHSY